MLGRRSIGPPGHLPANGRAHNNALGCCTRRLSGAKTRGLGVKGPGVWDSAFAGKTRAKVVAEAIKLSYRRSNVDECSIEPYGSLSSRTDH